MLSPGALGASLYVPATHRDLAEIANGEKLASLRSVIFCTEDAVTEYELGAALHNLSLALRNMKTVSATLRFVRVRNPEVMAQVLAMPGVEKLHGFVLPKITRHNFDAYFQQVRNTHHQLMPTLETAEVFDASEMKQFRQLLEAPDVRHRIPALRIGGNDLLALLGIRRPRKTTIYRTPLGVLIAELVMIFQPHGFALTAPVFEYLDDTALLAQEVAEDLAHGLIGKTAIHPDQAQLIEHYYRVGIAELEMARRIVDPASPAVFRMHGAMCEVATHRGWAHAVMVRAEVFGTI